MANESFIWGAGGAKLTPEQIAIAQQLLARKKMQGADTSPVQHWSQGAARVADALGDVLQEKRLGSLEKESSTYNNGLLSSLLGSSDTPAPATPGATGSAMPKVDASGNIPVATAPDDVKSLILANVPPEMQSYATNLIGKESSFNPNAVSPTGATGLAQFTKGTGSQYGLVSDQGDLRKDPVANLKALVALTNDNRAGLTKALGRAPTDGELALAHQQGLQGAVNLLSGKSVPGNNLAVNNIDPNSDPRAAANKIMAYYGGSGGQQAALPVTPQMPGEVASLDPSIGIPMPGAEGQMRAIAPAQPMPPQAAPQAALPALPASTVGPAPAVASVPPVGVPASDIPPEFQNSPQLMNADPKQGILAALLSGSPASPQQVAQAQTLGSQPQIAPSAPQGMGNEAIIRAITDPRASEGTRRIAGILLQQQQARQQAILQQQLQQNDPKYRQDLEKGNLELQNLRQPKMSPAEQAADVRDREKMTFEREKFDAELKKGQWQKLTDGRLYNETSGEFRDAPPPSPGSVTPKFDDVSGMRKEIQQLPAYKNLAAAAPIYKSMAETAGRDSKASDLNLVYGLGKIMDPTSVVREGEMIMVKNTASLPDWLQGAISSLNGGAALTPETRKAIMTEAYGRVKGYNDEFQQNMGQYQGIVQRNGINPADVIPEVDKFEPWAPPEPQTGAPVQIKNVDDYNGLPKGAQYLDPNGKLRTKQ